VTILYDVDEASIGTSSGRLATQSSKSVTWLLSSVALVGCVSGTSLSAPQQMSPSTALVGATRASRGSSCQRANLSMGLTWRPQKQFRHHLGPTVTRWPG